MTAKKPFTPQGVVLSSDVLSYIAARAAGIHHGSITIHINRDAVKHVDIEVVSRERFPTTPQEPS